MAQYDVIVVGGGHNGLTAAAYLAKAGLEVLVLEAKEYAGGGVVSQELTLPGFRHDTHATAHVLIQGNPMILDDELGLLSRHGLRYVHPDPCMTIVFPDGDYVVFSRDVERTIETIARISPPDAENYRRFYEFVDPLLDLLLPGMFGPPMPMGELFAQLDRTERGQELIRAMLMSYLDVCEEWFVDDKVKAALVRWVSELLVAPEDGATGAFLVLMVPMIHRFGFGYPVGGSGALTDALLRAVAEQGAVVRTGARVEEFRFSGDRVTGVQLADGETVEARRAVVANVNVKQVPELVGHRFGPDWEHKVRRLKHASFTLLAGHLAISEAPRFRAGPDVDNAGFQEVALPLPELRRLFDQLKYGVPTTRIPTTAVASNWDPTRAPAGRHTLYMLSYVPAELADGSWDDRKEELFDRVFETFCGLTTNMGPDKVLAREIHSPLDAERFNASWPGGDSGHLGGQLFQSLSYRPLPNMRYRLPAEGLYLVGPSAHPGFGVTGGARAGVQVVMEDLGIDFGKVVR